MRRFGFFLGVFSVGLVVFLVFTGQLGELFDSDPNKGQEGAIDRSATQSPEVQFTMPDFLRKRDMFSFKGFVEAENSFSMDHQWNTAWTLTDAVLDINLYADDDAGVPNSIFQLTSHKVHYRPNPQRILLERVSGRGEDGTAFDTDSVELTWNDTGEMRLVGSAPVQIGYPALKLHGHRGFVGDIASDTGLRLLEIHAPVVMAVNRHQGGNLFGLNSTMPADGDSATASNPSSDATSSSTSSIGVASGTRVFLVSDGPLRLSRDSKAPARALFNGAVTLFESDQSELWPAPTSPDTRLECADLQLELDPLTQRLYGAESAADGERVKFVIGDEYHVLGDRLRWSTGVGEALLAGDVEVQGPQGVFNAARARLLPLENTCYLEDEIVARLFVEQVVEAKGSGDGSRTERDNDNSASGSDGSEPTQDRATTTPSEEFATDLEFTADRAIVLYHESTPRGDDNSKGSRLKSIRALANDGRYIRVRQIAAQESEQLGAELLGRELFYDPAALTVRVTGGETVSEYPVFRRGRNEIRSRAMVIHRERHEVAFIDSAHCRLFNIPFAPGEEFRDLATPSEPNRPYDIRGHQLRLQFDPKTYQVQGLELVGESEPFTFETILPGKTGDTSSSRLPHVDRNFYRLQGQQLVWQRNWNPDTKTFDSEARITGDQPQRLEAWGTVLTASTIYFDPTRWLARAEGDVNLRTSRAAAARDSAQARRTRPRRHSTAKH